MKIFDDEKIIEAYKSGRSMNSIAREYDTYATTIKRVLISHEIEIRKDDKRKGALCVKDGEKLIEWAKAQGRQVTKAELADVLGRKRLSPSYFIKYPELGRYIVTDEQNEFEEYYTQLYEWLQKNGILYKTNDRTRLGVTVDVLLLGDYEGIAIQLSDRPRNVSTKTHDKRMRMKSYNAAETGLKLVFLKTEHFKNLDEVKKLLDSLKS